LAYLLSLSLLKEYATLFNYSKHNIWQKLILSSMTPVIDHIEANDVEIQLSLQKDSGMFGPLWWRYRQIGKGQVDWGQFIDALKLYGFKGTFSIHLDDEFIPANDISFSDALDECIQKLNTYIRDPLDEGRLSSSISECHWSGKG